MKLVSIIIPAYRLTPLLYGCLDSLKQTDYPNYEVIVIHSKGSFAENVNRGISASNGVYILLLNDDTLIIQKEWLTKLVEFMETDDKIGAVSPRMVFPDGRIQFGGMIFHDTFEGGHYGFGWNNDELVGQIREFQATTFGCVLLRKEALISEKLENNAIVIHDSLCDPYNCNCWKVLDENYKIGGFEDIDACFRMKLNGWKIFYYPHSIIIHYENQTFNAIDNTIRWGAFNKNRLYYHKKWDEYFKNGTFKVDDYLYEGGKK